MSPLAWIWLGGMLPVLGIAWADLRRNGDMPVWAILLAAVLWPLFIAIVLVHVEGERR